MRIEDLYRRWIDELWSGRLEVAPELVSNAFIGRWPTHEVRGPGELAELIGQTREMLQPLSFTIEVEPFGRDDMVAGRWRGHGWQEGKPVEFVGNDILRAEDGKFVEYWVASITI